MIRYSTPTIEIESDVDFNAFANIWFSFKQGDTILRKTKSEATIEGMLAKIELSQEETGMFSAEKPVECQVRWITSDNKAGGSNIVLINFKRVLEEGEITVEN